MASGKKYVEVAVVVELPLERTLLHMLREK
jgi:hypothetical protein